MDFLICFLEYKYIKDEQESNNLIHKIGYYTFTLTEEKKRKKHHRAKKRKEHHRRQDKINSRNTKKENLNKDIENDFER